MKNNKSQKDPYVIFRSRVVSHGNLLSYSEVQSLFRNVMISKEGE